MLARFTRPASSHIVLEAVSGNTGHYLFDFDMIIGADWKKSSNFLGGDLKLYFARREMRHFVGRTSSSVRVKNLGERRTRTSVVRLDLTRVKSILRLTNGRYFGRGVPSRLLSLSDSGARSRA